VRTRSRSLRRLGAALFLTMAFVTPGFSRPTVNQLPGIGDAPVRKHKSRPAAAKKKTTSAAAPLPPLSKEEAVLLRQLQALNQVPEEQLSERVDPGFSILKKIYDTDSPEFLTMRKLVARAPVRASFNPSVKNVIANILAQRWDTFPLCGNLWLAGLRSPNDDLRARARKRLVAFIQPAHVPELIELLRVPGPNVPAYEILQEVTGKNLDPSAALWRKWWAQTHGKVDLVGHLLKDTRDRIAQHPITTLDQDRFWHLPKEIHDANTLPEKRSTSEQAAVSTFNDWAKTDVKRYVDAWTDAKPLLDRISHQPDRRVNVFLEKLVADPGYGDYASVILAWRSSADSLPAIQQAYEQLPTVGRALARGSLGDKTALRDLLNSIEKNPAPPALPIMDDTVRAYVQTLHTVGVVSAERAFELLCHSTFELNTALTKSDEKKAVRKAKRWLDENEASLVFDRRRNYFVIPAAH
jgi:hypothetical protein